MERLPHSATIAAISTAVGPGGIAIVRLSGPDSLSIIAKIFRPTGSRHPLAFHKLYLGEIVDPETNRAVDQVLCSCMRSPHTYTREDVVEINAHGGPVVTRRILDLVLAAGARMAEPGEFTRRAFLAGRIDLSQAEAVAELVAARSQAEADLALAQLSGELQQEVEALKEPLIDVLAHLEVALDFPDEDAEIIQGAEAASRLTDEVLGPLDRLLMAYESGRIYREGLQAAIIGRPNVGKSSLLNRLARDERAIVTPTPGTTRDVIEVEALIEGVPMTLVDTAGLEATARDEAEAEGQRRAAARLAAADLVLFVLDRSQPLSHEDRRILSLTRNDHTIAVLNKADLAPAFSMPEAQELLGSIPALSVSAKTGEGLAELKAQIFENVTGGRTSPNHVPHLAPNLRHKQALQQARSPLRRAIQGLKQDLAPELIALEIRSTLDAIGLITGQTTTDEILDRIFEKFCLGK
ncbi:MAG: tRNA uridine-5-carboxymethylaminomethyl(34) synthesis GTPase MnmE [Deltaproteobacteria bacterium]|nr:tRNA uridine-5-carboxymethylaminomethyl(34) synthesis GTPase MnmE [Deltaproteobacteria bacterium]MBW2085657.1 tRNA uridine-5-carboxymethylaminomethyl(34) synthesis GTPase MnmE [Deltaproteobacteria bacterium]